MHKIIDVFTKQSEVAGYSRMVPLSEIANPANDYNLNIPRYIDSSEPEDIQDLRAHLHGGIPERDIDALADYWEAFPTLRQKLFQPLRDGYLELAVDPSDIQQTIMNAEEYLALKGETADVVSQWWQSHHDELNAIDSSTRPADLIESLSESLLALFRVRPLIDEYAVYEQLMSYWNETMHDDVALIMSEGWEGAAKPRKTLEDKDRKISETPDLVIGSGRSAAKYKMDLVPPQLIVARYFPEEQAKLDELNLRLEVAAQALEEFVEENLGEDGLLSAAMDEDKITKTLAAARLREAKREGSDSDEIEALTTVIALYEKEADAKKAAKEGTAALDSLVLAKCGELALDEVRPALLDGKWRSATAWRVDVELGNLMQYLNDRVKVLADRYGQTLAAIEGKNSELHERVSKHLAGMGVT
jgi:type I restriction enzyme M protein